MSSGDDAAFIPACTMRRWLTGSYPALNAEMSAGGVPTVRDTGCGVGVEVGTGVGACDGAVVLAGDGEGVGTWVDEQPPRTMTLRAMTVATIPNL